MKPRNTLEMVHNDLVALDVDVFDAPLKTLLAISSADGYIGIDTCRLATSAEVCTVLCHEAGHFLSGSFYKPLCTFEVRERAEQRASRAAIRRYIPFQELRAAMADGLTESWQLAEVFCVTEKTIHEAVSYYKDALGLAFEADLSA